MIIPRLLILIITVSVFTLGVLAYAAPIVSELVRALALR